MSFLAQRQFDAPTYFCVACGTVYSVETHHVCEEDEPVDEPAPAKAHPYMTKYERSLLAV